MSRNGEHSRAAFTLVELILVMALLATLMAFAAPLLSRSLRGRALEHEAARFLALTEFGRSEAVSRGVPMIVWVSPEDGRFGAEVKTGFEFDGAPAREFAVDPEVTMEVPKGAILRGVVQAVEFSPEGVPGASSAEEVRFSDRFGSVVSVARTDDGWGYGIGNAEAAR